MYGKEVPTNAMMDRKMEYLLKEIQSRLHEVERRQITHLTEAEREHWDRDAKTFFENTKSYTRIVYSIGYASLFAFLNWLKDDISRPAFFSALFFLAVSVYIYIAWELSQTFLMARLLKIIADPISAEDRRGSISNDALLKKAKIERAKDGVQIFTARNWLPVFLITICTGALAVLIVLLNLANCIVS